MAKIIIKFKGMVRGEVALKKKATTIGRTEANDIPVENLAVSRRHAEIVRSDVGFWVYDLQSSNGTFVNGVRVEKKQLKDGDTILVGKHTLLFVAEPGDAVSTASKDPDTLFRTTIEGDDPKSQDSEGMTTIELLPPKKQAAPGFLKVRQGKMPRSKYLLTEEATIIGREEYSEIRLSSPRAPRLAVVINRNGHNYTIAPSETGILLNNKKLIQRQTLKAQDFITIQDVVFEFFVGE